MTHIRFPDLNESTVYLDTETTGLRWWQDRVFGVSISSRGHENYYDLREVPRAIDYLKRELPRAKRIVTHNAKFDSHMLMNEGVPMDRLPIECTVVKAALVNEHEHSYQLDKLGLKYCDMRKVDIAEALAGIFGGRPTDSQMANLHRAPSGMVAEYAIQDVRILAALDQALEEEILNQELQQVWDLERQLTPVLIRMERAGVRVDLNAAERADKRLTKEVARLEKIIGSLNVNSPKQLREFFGANKVDGIWRAADGTPLESTDGGQASLNADALRSLKHPMAAAILELKKVLKTRDTFIRGHILGHHHDGIVHTNFNQVKGDNDLGTGTGRLSANDPALQQIPKRDQAIASIVRAIFVPYFGQRWLSCDWDQKEFRWFAHYTKNPKILAMYAADPDTDFHQAVADLTGLPRQATPGIKGNAKQINLGLVFGMGEGKLAQEMGLPYDHEKDSDGRFFLKAGPEAQALFQAYHEAVPGVREFLKSASSVARRRGYVKTIGGRHIRFPRGLFTHKAGGLIFQGSSADCMKRKLIELDREFYGSEHTLQLTVHDEINMSVASDGAKPRVKEIMEAFGPGDAIECRVPIRASVTIDTNWWEASK